MPKKFKGDNSKAAVARERRSAVKQAADEKKRKEEEDAYWEDDDRHAARKQDRKTERERKRIEQLEKKQEAKRLLEEEESSLPSKTGATKVTRAQIETIQAQKPKSVAAALPKRVTVEPDLEENPNVVLLRRRAEGHEDASTVDEAISLLSVSQPLEKHPEKRMKAAYTIFEERELPRLKAENPNLRMSQLKQLLRKDWMKSPENPLNQSHVSTKP